MTIVNYDTPPFAILSIALFSFAKQQYCKTCPQKL